MQSTPAAQNNYLEQLLRTARERRLWEKPQWQALLHYLPPSALASSRSGVRSLAESESFFLHPRGRANPRKELEATLRSFFRPFPEQDKEQSGQCRFPARYQWLKEELGFDKAEVPEQGCPSFARWSAEIAAREVSLIFPAAYLNNPSSMFGHTFLRLDSEQNRRAPLLDYTVGFIARTDVEKGPLYAFKGVTGGFAGFFSVLPYFEKVREYSDLESRDIREYRLGLTPAEVRRLVMHLWELQGVSFRYYFFDENCSYQLLSLLEAARPELSLVDRFFLYAVPGDTVAAVAEQPGLVAAEYFRPSRKTKLAQRAKRLARAQVVLARELATGSIEPHDRELMALNPETRARVFELALELQQRLEKTEIPGDPESAERFQALLLARSRLAVLPERTSGIVRQDAGPEEGHGSGRIGLGMGFGNRGPYWEAQLRPVLHDFMDPPRGYETSAALEIMKMTLRYEQRTGRLFLPELLLVDIRSEPLVSALATPLSWHIGMSLGQKRLDDDSPQWTGAISAGAGLSAEWGERVQWHILAGPECRFGRGLEAPLVAGADLQAGMVADFGDRFRLGLSGRLAFFGGSGETVRSATLAGRYCLSRKHAIGLELAHEREFRQQDNRLSCFFYTYF